MDIQKITVHAKEEGVGEADKSGYIESLTSRIREKYPTAEIVVILSDDERIVVDADPSALEREVTSSISYIIAEHWYDWLDEVGHPPGDWSPEKSRWHKRLS